MWRICLLWLAGATVTVLVLEVAFRLLPVSTSTASGYYNDPLIMSYPPRHRWITSTGWDLRNARMVQANRQGFVADQDFKANSNAVALIGDSFVEASMLPAVERPGHQLQRTMLPRPVYAMGSPGSALLDYAERIRFAHEKYDVHDFVILMETGDVRQSLCGSGNVHGPCLDKSSLQPRIEVKPSANTAKRMIRHLRLAQYLISQLKVNPEAVWTQTFKTPPTSAATSAAPFSGDSSAATIAVTEAFFARVKPRVKGRLVIVIDSDRRSLYQGLDPHDPERTRFISLAREAGARVVDSEPIFKAHIASSKLKLDVGPSDAHLNSLGIRLLMDAAAVELKRP